jgi:glycosyltransferase involved in cell wall biosynthesis
VDRVLRVLHVTPALAPVYGGPSQLLPRLVRKLSQSGLMVDVATTDANGAESLPVPLGQPVEVDGLRAYYFHRHWPSWYTTSWPLTRWLWREGRNYQLFHITAVFSFPSLAAACVASRLGIPYIVSPHGMLEPWALRYKAWKKGPYFAVVERSSLQRAAGLQALTLAEARQLRDLGLRAPTFVVPNGVDLEEFRGLPDREVFTSLFPEVRGRTIVLFMGRLDPKKGLDVLVAAFARMVGTMHRKDVCLVVAGPDLIGYRPTLERLVEKAQLNAHVVFTGNLAGERKLAALGAADVFVLPSRSEGLSVAVLEAMAAGCPVIVTRACNMPEIEEREAGVVVGDGDVTALANALAALVGDAGLRRAMGERGSALVRERFSWPSVAARMADVYEDIVSGRHVSSAWVTEELQPGRGAASGMSAARTRGSRAGA